MTSTQRAASWIRINLVAVALGLAAGGLGWALQGGTTLFTQNWPQVGVGLAVARISRLRAWLGIWIAMTVTFDWVVGAYEGVQAWLIRIFLGATMAFQVLLGAHFLRPVDPPNPVISRAGVLRLFLLSGLVAGLVGTLFRLALTVPLGAALEDLPFLVAYRFSSHVEGVMVMAPLLFMVWYSPKPTFRPTQYALAAWILLSLLVLTYAASTRSPIDVGTFRGVLLLLILPLTVLAALRLGAHGAVAAVFAASFFPTWATVRGLSPFGAPAGMGSEILLEVFLVVTSVTTLLVAAVLEEEKAATGELLEAKATLENRVRDRTRQLRSERDFTSTVLDTVGALIVVTDEEGRILRFNRACEELTGKHFEDVQGKSVWEIGVIPEDEIDLARSRVHSTVATGENHWIAKDGSLRLFHWTNTRSPEVPGIVISVGLDVTEARRAQREADDAIEARDEFLSVASHELKTPLTTLQLQIQSLQRLARREPEASEEVTRRLGITLRQALRLASLINELLDVSRIMHGSIGLELAPTDMAAIVREAIDRHAADAQQAGSTITTEGLDRPLVGLWDALRVDQIVANLLSNAIKYGEGRPVEVRLRRVEDRSELSVTDHGIGISPEDQRRIFDRFERAVSTRHYGGFGLGLWITRQIVESHGGTIAVSSEEGRGSTFTVQLPLKPPGSEAKPPTGPEPSGAEPTGPEFTGPGPTGPPPRGPEPTPPPLAGPPPSEPPPAGAPGGPPDLLARS